MERELLRAYDGVHFSRAEVARPSTEEGLLECLQSAERAQRRVTFRAAGHSFEQQALNDDLVISTMAFDEILSFEPALDRIRVQPGVSWGEVVRRIRGQGLVPYSTVTSSRATVGGTVSGACLSRFSPAAGKEPAAVRSIRLVTPCGTIPCGPDDDQRKQLFYAAVGGLGYLGAITEIELKLHRAFETPEDVQVESVVTRAEGFDQIVEDVIPALQELFGKTSSLTAVHALLFFKKNKPRGFITRSRYACRKPLRRFPVFSRSAVAQFPFQVAMRSGAFNKAALNFLYDRYPVNRQTFVDPLEDYLFFMDGHTNAKQISEQLGFLWPSIQQTYMIPFHFDKEDRSGPSRLRTFLEAIQDGLMQRKLTPVLFDLMCLPQDNFLLSSNYDAPGYAISLAFEPFRLERELDAVQDFLEDLAAHAAQLQGARVHLVKHVFAQRGDVRCMYQSSMPAFLALKKQFDPAGTIANTFFDRLAEHSRAR